MKKYILPFVATLCIAVFGSAVVADTCDPVKTLALNMYFEARGEGKNIDEKTEAMQMVGEVTLNRVRSENYPNTICKVVYQKSQFAWTVKKNQTPYETEVWDLALVIAESLVDGSADYFDNGATHFINPTIVGYTPRWARKFERVRRVGNHVFYSDGSVPSDQ